MSTRTFQPIYIHNPAFTLEEKKKNPNKWITIGIISLVVISMVSLVFVNREKGAPAYQIRANHEPNLSLFTENRDDAAANYYDRSESSEDEAAENELAEAAENTPAAEDASIQNASTQASISTTSAADADSVIQTSASASVDVSDHIPDEEIINDLSVSITEEDDEDFEVIEHDSPENQ